MLGKRELICLLLFTCNYVVSVRRGFLFLWVLGMGCVLSFVELPEPSISLIDSETKYGIAHFSLALHRRAYVTS